MVLCNCDDPRESAFFEHFAMKFDDYKLKKLIAICYKSDNPCRFSKYNSNCAVWQYIENKDDLKADGSADKRRVHKMNFDGDFRNKDSIELLKEADIVVTNPPFSLFREYVEQLIEYKKKFLILGNFNAITYKEIFPLVKSNKIWLGVSPRSMDFKCSNGEMNKVNACWYTNLDHAKRHENIILYKKYTSVDYEKYDNYDAINVDYTKDIPMDYSGAMGVPISFMDKFNPSQFEIIDSNDIRLNSKTPFKQHGLIKDKDGTVVGNPKAKYVRIVIKHYKSLNINKT